MVSPTRKSTLSQKAALKHAAHRVQDRSCRSILHGQTYKSLPPHQQSSKTTTVKTALTLDPAHSLKESRSTIIHHHGVRLRSGALRYVHGTLATISMLTSSSLQVRLLFGLISSPLTTLVRMVMSSKSNMPQKLSSVGHALSVSKERTSLCWDVRRDLP